MITPIHISVSFIAGLAISKTTGIPFGMSELVILWSAEFIDLDHLASRPIYKYGRNPFKTHFLHKRWKLILAASILFLFIKPFFFLGVGLLMHLFLDYIYVLIHKNDFDPAMGEK